MTSLLDAIINLNESAKFDNKKIKKLSDIDLLNAMETAKKSKDKKTIVALTAELKSRGQLKEAKKTSAESAHETDDKTDDQEDLKKKKNKKKDAKDGDKTDDQEDEIVVHEKNESSNSSWSFGEYLAEAKKKKNDKDSDGDPGGSPDLHIINQLRKTNSISVLKILFDDGKKQSVAPKVVQKALKLYAAAKGADAKEKLQDSFSKSLESLIAATK